MSIVKKTGSLIKENWYDILFMPVFALFLTALIKSITPVFDALPSEFDGIARMTAVVLSFIGMVRNRNKLSKVFIVSASLICGAGLLVFLEKGSLYLLDIAILVLLISAADLKNAFISASTLLSCVTGATMICSRKGFIRDYYFYDHEAFGFRMLGYYYLTLILIAFFSVWIIHLLVKKKDIKRTVFYLFFGSLVASVVVVLPIKALNLSAAVEQGEYEFYWGESILGIEAQMKGFENFNIALGSTAPSEFTITPDGNYYTITFDSYGVAKTLCVIDGELYLGNFDQSAAAHTWDIEAVAGTPYFTVVNVETGLEISADNNSIELIAEGTGNENCFFRIGDENIDYYEGIAGYEATDLHNASVVCSSEVAYTGGAAIPDNVTVVLNGRELKPGEDYELSFWNNYIPGTAYITVTGTGDYTGSCCVSYEIVYGSNLDLSTYRSTADYVVRTYRMAYLRFPSVEELEIMSQILIDGDRTPDSVVWELYWNDVLDGHSNAAFMEVVYRLMLLRNGSRGELEVWIGALETGSSRSDVISAISESPDYQNIWHNFGISFR